MLFLSVCVGISSIVNVTEHEHSWNYFVQFILLHIANLEILHNFIYNIKIYGILSAIWMACDDVDWVNL